METGSVSTERSNSRSRLHVSLSVDSADGNGGSSSGGGAGDRQQRGRRRGREGRPRKRQKCCCQDRNVKRGVGAVVFTLGIPTALAGVILTVVAYSALVAEAPASFPVLGPALLALSALLFFSGAALTELIPPAWLADCCCLPESLQAACWRRCPALCRLLRPHHVRVLDKGAALQALTTEPSRSALKKPRPPPPPPPQDVETCDGEKATLRDQDVARDVSASTAPRRSRGVTFSDSGDGGGESGGGGNGVGDRASVSTDVSDNGSGADVFTSLTSSAVSLRHCRIHPASSDESWTAPAKEPPVFTISETPETPAATPQEPPSSDAVPPGDTAILMEKM